jgi:hypothetical protein
MVNGVEVTAQIGVVHFYSSRLEVVLDLTDCIVGITRGAKSVGTVEKISLEYGFYD